MSDPLQPVENEATKTAEAINAAIDAAEQKVTKNKIIFWLIIVILVILSCLIFYLKDLAQKKLEERIVNDNIIMKNMQDSVKLRDQRIISISNDMKKQDAVIAKAQDSIAKAYVVIGQLKINKSVEKQNHAKDSIAISRLDLRGKLRFLTGGQR